MLVVEKTAKKFCSFAEADKANRDFYKKFTGNERLQILVELLNHGLSKNWREFLELLNSRGVEYVIVGAHSLALHGRPLTQAILIFWCDPRVKTHVYSSIFLIS
jgi:hypothetical protein